MSEHIETQALIKAEKYRTELKARQHVFYADEPIAMQGSDTAVTPHELLTSALAACTAITLKMYAERKGWDTGEIRVDIVLDTEKGDSKFLRKLHFQKDLPTEQRERLQMVANACPVHKVLTGKIEIETALS